MERCEECAHYKVCKEVNDLKCRDQIIWYDAKSGCPYYSADVVPRSEVDRIFEEIEDVINNIGYFDELDFAELKKKYTEEKK